MHQTLRELVERTLEGVEPEAAPEPESPASAGG